MTHFPICRLFLLRAAGPHTSGGWVWKAGRWNVPQKGSGERRGPLSGGESTGPDSPWLHLSSVFQHWQFLLPYTPNFHTQKRSAVYNKTSACQASQTMCASSSTSAKGQWTINHRHTVQIITATVPKCLHSSKFKPSVPICITSSPVCKLWDCHTLARCFRLLI